MLNHGSGRDDGMTRERVIRDVLGRAGRPHSVLSTSDAGELDTLARQAVERAEAEDGAVVVAGGDGTINAVLRRVLPGGRPFGILAQGTFNYTGRSHGIPEDTRAAVEALLKAREKPIQVGLVNGRPFLVNASLGLYPQLLEDREGFKQRFGRSRLVAMWAGLLSLLSGYRQLSLHVDRDGAEAPVRTSTVVVGNNRLQLEQIGVGCSSAVERGRLAAIAVRPVGGPALVWLALRGLIGRLGEADDAVCVPFERLRIRPRGAFRRQRVKVALDGELVWLRFPLEFRPAPQPLRLLVPEDAEPERA